MRHSMLIPFLILQCAFGADQGFEMHTSMMQSTVKIVGQNSLGSGFLMWHVSKTDPKRGSFILFTANHVFREIKGEKAKLVCRTHDEKGVWTRVEDDLKIRDGEKELWFKNVDVDIAAIPINEAPPRIIKHLSTLALLVDDDFLESEQFHPGDEIFCVGYPLGLEANKQGFPILRSGRIASYPLTPTKDHKLFLFDGRIFPGNSGGPAYFSYDTRMIGGALQMSRRQGIIGLVLTDLRHVENSIQVFEKRQTETSLSFGGVVHASFLKKLAESIPVEEKAK